MPSSPRPSRMVADAPRVGNRSRRSARNDCFAAAISGDATTGFGRKSPVDQVWTPAGVGTSSHTQVLGLPDKTAVSGDMYPDRVPRSRLRLRPAQSNEPPATASARAHFAQQSAHCIADKRGCAIRSTQLRHSRSRTSRLSISSIACRDYAAGDMITWRVASAMA